MTFNRPALSLRWLVPLILAAVAVADIAATDLFLIPAMESRLEQRARLDLRNRTATLQGTLETFFHLGAVEGVRREIAAASAVPENRWLLVLDDHRAVVAASDLRWLNRPVEELALPIDPAMIAAVATSGGAAVTNPAPSLLLGYAGVGIGTQAAEIRSPRIGTVIIARDTAFLTAENRRMATRSIAVLSLLIAAATTVIGVVFHLLLTRRVERLLNFVRSLAAGNFAARSRIGGGDEIGALGTAFDAMAALLQDRIRQTEESERRFRELFDESPVALWEEDFSAVKATLDGLNLAADDDLDAYFDAHPEHVAACASRVTVTAVNAAAVRLHRAQSVDHLLGDLPKFFSAASLTAFRRELVAMVRGQTRLEMEGEVLTADGTPLTVLVLWNVPSGFEASFKRVLVSLIDVTENRKTARALGVRTAELERSNTDLEQFAYVASHDLREPLRMIGSYVALLKRRYHDKLDAEGLEFIAFASEGAARMDRLVQDLLEFSRVGRSGPPPALVPIKRVLDTVLDGLTVMIRESGAEIQIPADLPTLACREGDMARLFQNLIANAVKFRAKERPAVVTVGCQAEEDGWHFTVTDNGIGIEEVYFNRIFMIFQRLHPRGDYDGTGIGLAICKKIAEGHGGRIWATSQPGVGTTIHVMLRPLDLDHAERQK